MSVLTKGMKMPENCEKCPIREGTFCDIINKDIDRFYRGSIKRDPDCPLVELPEHHGRLIDENEVRIVMNWLLTQPQRPTWNDTYHAIQEMNAVVEAEESE